MKNETYNTTNNESYFYNNSKYMNSYIDNIQQEKYILPSMILVGAFGNILTIILFRSGKQKRMSVSVYVCAYCIGNLSNLFFNYGLYLLTLVSDFPELSTISKRGCSLYKFAENMAQFCSIWFVVGMTVDRYIAVCHPANATTMCTVFMAKVAVGIILIGLVVVSVHAMWVYDLYEGQCEVMRPENYLQLVHYKIWSYLSATAYAYLPLIILLFLNILLTFGLCFQHSSSRDNVSTEYTNAVVAISMTYFTLVLPGTIIGIVYRTGGTIKHETQLIFDYVQRVNLVDVFFICLLFSRSFRQEIQNVYRQLRERRKHALEMNRLSNKALITNDTTNTTTHEEDTLI